MTTIIETRRLFLRPWQDGDAAIMTPIYSKENVMRYIPGGAWTPEGTVAALGRFVKRESETGFGLYPVVRKSDGAVIGHSGLTKLSTGEVEVDYLFDEPFWGQGYATEIATAVVADAFNHEKLDQIIALAFPDNGASIRVMQKIGMELEGIASYFGFDMVKYHIERITPNGSA